MNPAPEKYDVFFSYNWRDREAVENVAWALRERDLKVFLDRWYLVAGRPWPQALEEALNSCRAVAVFLGPQGMGRWQQREKDLALDRQARDPRFPVIPVLLAAAEPALGFLSLNTWVDLSSRQESPLALEILAAAIRGEAPGPAFQERIQATLAAVCPYRGLRPFREEDASFFFGTGNLHRQAAASCQAAEPGGTRRGFGLRQVLRGSGRAGATPQAGRRGKGLGRGHPRSR